MQYIVVNIWRIHFQLLASVSKNHSKILDEAVTKNYLTSIPSLHIIGLAILNTLSFSLLFLPLLKSLHNELKTLSIELVFYRDCLLSQKTANVVDRLHSFLQGS